MKNIFLIFSVFLASCGPEDNNQSIVDINIEISIKNNAVDLLDPQNANSYQEGDIKLFYLQQGEKIEVNHTNLTYPKGFFIFKHENAYRMRIFPNSGIYPGALKPEAFPVTLIQWKGMETDTLKCSVEMKPNSIICQKVWFNGKLMWEAYQTERFFEINK